jgi:septation ring formation regulator EzrA
MENEEPKEPQETQETQNTAPTPEDLDAIKAQLEEEKKAKAAAEAALAEKDRALSAMSARQAELEASLSEAKTGSEAAAAELSQVKEAHGQAISKYLGAIRLANPTIPQDIIAGDTIEDIDASLAKATTIAESVKASLEAQAKEAKVPAGAPPRGEISLEGLTPREKIAAGIQQKQGGT